MEDFLKISKVWPMIPTTFLCMDWKFIREPLFHDQQIREMQSERMNLERELYLQALHKTASMNLIQRVRIFPRLIFKADNLKVWDGQPYGSWMRGSFFRWCQPLGECSVNAIYGKLNEKNLKGFHGDSTRLQQASND